MVLADSFYYQPVQIDTINTRVNADLFAKEGDANGRGMVVQITENGIIKDTTGITLRLQWSHISVGVSGFTDFEVVDATKGLYKLVYPTSMLHRGRVEAFIRITDNGTLSGTRNLLITVERMVGSDETIEASDDFSALQSALTKLSIWEATISGKVDAWEVDMEATKQLYIDTLDAAEAAYPQELVSLRGQLAQLNYINIADFGAQMDGLTDDTQALKDAIAYSQSHKNSTILISGSVLITEKITVPVFPYSLNIEGKGRDSVIIVDTPDTCFFMGVERGQYRFNVKNIRAETTTAQSFMLLENNAWTGSTPTLENVFMVGFQGYALNFKNTYRLRIINCECFGGNSGLYVEQLNGAIIAGFACDTMTGNGIKILIGYASTFSGLVFENMGECGLIIEGGGGYVVNGIYLEKCGISYPIWHEHRNVGFIVGAISEGSPTKTVNGLTINGGHGREDRDSDNLTRDWLLIEGVRLLSLNSVAIHKKSNNLESGTIMQSVFISGDITNYYSTNFHSDFKNEIFNVQKEMTEKKTRLEPITWFINTPSVPIDGSYSLGKMQLTKEFTLYAALANVRVQTYSPAIFVEIVNTTTDEVIFTSSTNALNGNANVPLVSKKFLGAHEIEIKVVNKGFFATEIVASVTFSAT